MHHLLKRNFGQFVMRESLGCGAKPRYIEQLHFLLSRAQSVLKVPHAHTSSLVTAAHKAQTGMRLWRFRMPMARRKKVIIVPRRQRRCENKLCPAVDGRISKGADFASSSSHCNRSLMSGTNMDHTFPYLSYAMRLECSYPCAFY